MALLDINDLSVTFTTNDGDVHAVNNVNLSLERGETLGIVGESGSGKSQLSFAVMGLLAKNGRATGSVKFDGQEILNAKPKLLNQIRAENVAMIFQDPMTSLNPYMRVSDQMAEVLMLHHGLSKRAAVQDSIRMLDAVRIPDAKGRARLYPHEFSGGMRQRVMIAMALLSEPEILIEQLDYVYEIRRLQKKSAGSDVPLWTMSRPTAYRLVKRVMNRAGIVGKQATGKGLRHGFGVAMVTAKKPLPLHVLSQLMGHTDTKTTEIYLQVTGEEKRQMVVDAWEK